MGSFRAENEEKDDDDDRSCSSSDDSSSSHCSSSSDASYYFSDESLFVSASTRAKRMVYSSVIGGREQDSFFRLPSKMRQRRTNNNNDDDVYGSRLNRRHEEVRRQVISHDEEYKYQDDYDCSSSDDSYSSKARKRKKKGRGNTDQSSYHWSTRLLAFSVLVWCGVHLTTTRNAEQNLLRQSHANVSPETRNRRDGIGIGSGKPHRPHRGGTGNFDPSHNNPHPHRPPARKKNDKEKLQPGCKLDPEWQTPDSNSKLLSCQLLHELDLSDALSTQYSSSTITGKRRSLSPSAHLGSGLWRDVWKIRDPTSFGDEKTHYYVVLKTMKPEHDVIDRNLERHRREAATMSRLTSSPYVADLYAYCGNSILTEFATQDLSRELDTKGERNANDGKSERMRRIRDANRARRAKEYRESERQLRRKNAINDVVVVVDRDVQVEAQSKQRRAGGGVGVGVGVGASQTLSSTGRSKLPIEKRLGWAIQASQAIADMHRADVIHADITAKQFLVVGTGAHDDNYNTIADSNQNNVRIKINDFNRCRFVPRRQQSRQNQTATDISPRAIAGERWRNNTERCTIRIPSAPGSYRSPEEYSDKTLTPQMDVFSLGHVLYEIWTSGQKPWEDVGGTRVKNMVMDGKLPSELKRLEEWDSMNESGEQQGQDSSGTNGDAGNDDLDADDRSFGRIIRDCYWIDPERRTTAEGLVQELSKLFESVQKRNHATK